MPTSHSIDFIAADEPLVGLVTKFGGLPSWLEQPVMPLSRRTGEPMTFIGQIVVPTALCPDKRLHVAYIFMTGSGFDERAIETWGPENGETSVILQRSTHPPANASPYPRLLKRWDQSEPKRVEVPCEYQVLESSAEEAEYMTLDQLDSLPEGERMRIAESWRGNKIGGSPYWVQSDEFPLPADRLLLQLEDGSYPFNLNLGTGVGYVFIDSACEQGRLLWQC